ncbi:flagellar basal body P-ring formation chaperone FlgA [Burkholderia sp. Ax-1724]|uniref:flagellar basal body P-ring formation chaperone FlgA n=2 Tax=Burkholderiaceae TaxID=119060 RepID=UPI001422C608|nr:flagellar basal body P-ring formation chaperone FlgA [Burkholderia sp. Ax-1724]NIF55200.1 flagellar basal body P-ring formation protein FlgA [Burkholderia sp. Ax-1724]
MDQPTSALPQRAYCAAADRADSGASAGMVAGAEEGSRHAMHAPRVVPRVAVRAGSRLLARLCTRLVVQVALWVAGGIVLLPATTQAQAQEHDGGGPIVIPGPGEKNPAALNDLVQQMQTPAQRASSAASLAAATAQSLGRAPASRPTADNDAFARAAGASGAIVIPGAGEAPATAPALIRTSFRPDANGVVTIPAPANAGASGVARVNIEPAARTAVPVTVTPAPNGAGAANARPVAANVPQGGFDSLAARGEPPEFGANGKPIASVQPQAGAVATVAVAATPARTQVAAARQPVTALTLRNQQMAAAAAIATPAQAAPLPGQQDPEAIHAAALAFLQQQSAGLPGKVDITVAPAFPRGLAACTSLEPFLPSGARLWGRMTVGVRCAGEKPWTLYLQARIALHATYYLASRAMAPGEVLTAADLVARDGDLTGLPQAIVTDPSQAVGSVSLVRIASGMPLRRDMLKSASAVAIGQTVRVVAAGDGFSISAEGSAMSNASPGQQVRVKTANGQIISGIVKDGGTVEIQM